MGVNSINAYVNQYAASNSTTKSSARLQDNTEDNETATLSEAAVYEKSGTISTGTSSKSDSATIERLKKEAEERTSALKTLFEKVLLKQGKTSSIATDLLGVIKSGDFEIDEETQSKAQEDISEDGYWGVEQTSDRLVSFATALCGNDTEKADEMIAAVQKGYEMATKAWGDELPDLCKQTYDAFLTKMDNWKNSQTDSASETSAAQV